MRHQLSYLLFSVFILFSCASNETIGDQEDELIQLNQQRAAIEQMAVSETCTENTNCKSVAFGSKPCGGSWSYLAYNSAINETLFLDMVEAYNTAENAYNIKWGIASDCMAVGPPLRVECIDGKCTAIYN